MRVSLAQNMTGKGETGLSTGPHGEPARTEDNWTLHESLGRHYREARERRGGKSLRYLIARANRPRLMLSGKQRIRNARRRRGW